MTIRNISGLARDRHIEGRSDSLARGLGFFWLIAFAVITVMPFVWMFTSSFKPSSVVFEMPPTLLPSEPTLNNFQRLFRYKDAVVLDWLWNSAVIALAVTFGNLIVASWAGYALAKMQFIGRRAIFWAVLASMMIPGQVTLIPVYMLVYRLNWLDSLPAFIFPAIGQPFGIFLMKTVHADLALQPH